MSDLLGEKVACKKSVGNSCSAVRMRLEPKDKDLGGFSVRRLLPAKELRSVGPFIFFDHLGLRFGERFAGRGAGLFRFGQSRQSDLLLLGFLLGCGKFGLELGNFRCGGALCCGQIAGLRIHRLQFGVKRCDL